MSDVTERIRSEMAAVFGVAAADIPADAAPGRIEKWNSLGHMQLIVALEEAFKIRFGDDDLIRLVSLPEITATVTRKLGGQP